ncbi:MAG: hypothetical protein D6722_05400 [Bacteroidetes bacterium]|nr:MAG: hypothetical protein D6722_05400 [Bacteroidota bacterium]
MEALISKKAARVLDLLEQIESVNEMIRLHEGDAFMQGQYQSRKQQFIQDLAEELKAFDIEPHDLAA